MLVLWPRRLLRGFDSCSRASTFQRDRSPVDCLSRAWRDVELVLRPSPLHRAGTHAAAQGALRSRGCLRAPVPSI